MATGANIFAFLTRIMEIQDFFSGTDIEFFTLFGPVLMLVIVFREVTSYRREARSSVGIQKKHAATSFELKLKRITGDNII